MIVFLYSPKIGYFNRKYAMKQENFKEFLDIRPWRQIGTAEQEIVLCVECGRFEKISFCATPTCSSFFR